MHSIYRILPLTIFLYSNPYTLNHTVEKLVSNQYTIQITVRLAAQEHMYAVLTTFTPNTPTIAIQESRATPKAIMIYDSTRKIKTLGWQESVTFELICISTQIPIAAHAAIYVVLCTNTQMPTIHTIPLEHRQATDTKQPLLNTIADQYIPHNENRFQIVSAYTPYHSLYWLLFDHTYTVYCMYGAYALTMLSVLSMIWRRWHLGIYISNTFFLCTLIFYVFYSCTYAYQQMPYAYSSIPIGWLIAGILLLLHGTYKKLSIISGLIMLSIAIHLMICALLLHKGFMSIPC